MTALSSDLGNSPLAERCPFCVEFADFANSQVRKLAAWPWPDREIYSTRTMTIIPGFGPQVFPYFLIVARRHLRTSTELTSDEFTDVLRCADWLRYHPSLKDRTLFVFEHGSGPTCFRSCGVCVEHFHLHCVFEPVDVVTPFVSAHSPKQLDSWSRETVKLLTVPYLLAVRVVSSARLGECFAKSFGERIPAQYFRQIIGTLINDPRWQWQRGLNTSLMREAYVRFGPSEAPGEVGSQTTFEPSEGRLPSDSYSSSRPKSAEHRGDGPGGLPQAARPRAITL